MNYSKELNKKDEVASAHDRVILITSLTIGIAFLCMFVLNIFAYMTVSTMSEKNAFLQNAAVNIKFKITNANLLFREIISEYTDKDMNAVWNLFKDASGFLPAIAELDPNNEMEGKIQKYKEAILKCYQEKDSKKTTYVAEINNQYDKAFADVINSVDNIENNLKELAVQKMLSLKTLYVGILINFLILFWFTIYTFRRYVIKRRRAELELRETQNDMNTLFNSLDSIMIAIDSVGAITKWNNAAEKYFGIQEEDALEKRFWIVIPFLEQYKAKIESVGASKKAKEFYKEKIVTDKEHVFNIIINPVARGNNGVVIRLEDITGRELMEEQVRQSQKLEIFENLIGGLAHDFNNVLGAITGTISMMKFSLSSKNAVSDDIKNNMDLIESSTERAVVMVQQLLAISTKHDFSFIPVDLNMSVMHVLKICQNTFDKRIELVAEIYDIKSMANADAAQVELALLNLCDNAAQAMTIMRAEESLWGGTLTIRVDRICADKDFRLTHPQADQASYWIISVTDTGIGMEKDLFAKIFDPFFTTKSREQGTGLGLTMVSDIISKHKGFIDVSSEPGKGTTFQLYFPEFVTVQEATEEGEEESLQPALQLPDVEQIPTGNGLILVADDEAIMRKTAGSILEKLGYDVVYAEDGQDAVRVFAENVEKIRATLLDLSMPKMSGKEAYIEMKKIRPDLKVLLVSGFKKDEKILEVLELGVNGFVQKPYSMLTLAQELKNIIR